MNKMLLEIKNLYKYYPVNSGLLSVKKSTIKALNGISLKLRKGETLGLVGESGCGKSTLARIVTGLESPDKGEVLFEGKNISSWPRKKLSSKIQMVFQDPYSSLNPRQKIFNVIAEGMKIHKTGSASEIKDRVKNLLEQVGLLPEHSKRYPHEFSGGQRQRIAIARAISLNPDLIVCDEPVSALDVSVQAQVIRLLKKIQTEYELSYLFISHDLSVVSYISDRIAVMYLGRLMETSPAGSLYSNPLHPYTRTLLDAVPIPDPDHIYKSDVLSGDIPSPVDPPKGCPFHPRCRESKPECSLNFPEWKEIEPEHFVSCHLY
ncbi:ABC transporter ATP-binding protein [Maridesulfovibrio bastinii]|uniref:ABC transporter ATP-binding protein n=1 Tax=Maridesulfovibrio bastinii TaxID=47157 RepID=UPI000419850C|nr:oligopeptide/dipeptide ABC transporter ATP-binding protein [Maridesulfovibrio bastinii]